MLKTMQFNNETFKEIPGFNGKYFISKNGRVISTLFNKVKELKPSKTNDGYLSIRLSDGARPKQVFIHRLVIQTYVLESTEWPKDMVTDHVNGIKDDNRLENLELVTNQENLRRAFDKGGYINKYIPVKARNWETKEVILFESCNACEKHVGICKDLITGTGRMDNPHKVYPEGWQYCRPDQEFPDENLVFLTEKEKPVSVKNILTTEEYDFDTLSDAAKYLNLPLTTLWHWLSKEEQPFVPDSHLVKFRDNPNPWRLVLDPLKELIDKKTELEPVLVYNENEKPMLFMSVVDAGKFFNVGKTTISYRCRNKLDVGGYKWLHYKDWVVLKPFELRGPLDRYLVPTQDSDIPEGSSNQTEMVKSKIIEKIRSQDSAFENIPRSKIDSVIRRKLSLSFKNMDKDRLPDYWKDKETFLVEVKNLPGYNEKDLYFSRIKLKLNVKKDGRVFNDYHSRENSIFVTTPEYKVE
jgi:hypothetical protein|nr:MAG TPA: homing endonuclease [Caudoviricetes sp.]